MLEQILTHYHNNNHLHTTINQANPPHPPSRRFQLALATLVLLMMRDSLLFNHAAPVHTHPPLRWLHKLNNSNNNNNNSRQQQQQQQQQCFQLGDSKICDQHCYYNLTQR